MSPTQRVQAVLSRQLPDHPPVSFWHHFPAHQVHGPDAVAAHLDHLASFDLDFLKVMNDNTYPHHTPVDTVADLASILPLRGDEPEFQRQLDLLSDLSHQLRGRVLMTTTIFNSWAVLRHLIRPPTAHSPPQMDAASDQPSLRIRQFLAKDEPSVKAALRTIATNMAGFTRRCIAAGADGIFLSVRDDWVEAGAASPGQYARLVREHDLHILSAAKHASFNMLHVCGNPVNFRSLADYPVHAINWADRAAGPSIAAVHERVKPAICGGVDNLKTLPEGTPQQIHAEVADALRQAAGRPMMICPGCTYDPQRVPRENLRAMVHAARGLA